MAFPTVLIADADQTFAAQLRQELESTGICDQIFTVDNMDDALALMTNQKIDILMTEVFIFRGDGIALLEQVHRSNRNAVVVLISGLIRSGVFSNAVFENVDLLFSKPCAVSAVCDSLSQLLSSGLIRRRQQRNLDADISVLIRSLGISPHVKGYHYLREAVEIVLRDPSAADGVTKQIYPEIARKFQTNTNNVERAIRYAVSDAWKKYRSEKWRSFFTGVELRREHPSNSTVICVLAEHYRLYGVEKAFPDRLSIK